MDTIALILHSLSAAVLVGGMVLLFFAVTPATWLIDDEALRRTVTRVVATRFAWMTGGALVLLLLTGIYQFTSDTITPPDVRADLMASPFGPIFVTKMALTVLFVALVGVHGMYFGPRIARAAEAVLAGGDDEAAWRLTNLRRTSLVFSLVMLIVAVAVLALGVTLGNHGYSQVRFD